MGSRAIEERNKCILLLGSTVNKGKLLALIYSFNKQVMGKQDAERNMHKLEEVDS